MLKSWFLMFFLMGWGKAVLFNDTAGILVDWGPLDTKEDLAISGGLEDSTITNAVQFKHSLRSVQLRIHSARTSISVSSIYHSTTKKLSCIYYLGVATLHSIVYPCSSYL